MPKPRIKVDSPRPSQPKKHLQDDWVEAAVERLEATVRGKFDSGRPNTTLASCLSRQKDCVPGEPSR